MRTPEKLAKPLTFLPVTSAILDQTTFPSMISHHPLPLPLGSPLTDRPTALEQDEQGHTQTQLRVGCS